MESAGYNCFFIYFCTLIPKLEERKRQQWEEEMGKRILMKDPVNLKLPHFLRLIADAVSASTSEIKLT